MTVAWYHIPPKSLPFCPDVSHGHDFLQGAVQLYSVVVQNADEMVSPEFGGGHGSLPDTALLNLTVAHDHIGIGIQSLNSVCHGHAQAGGKSQPQRTCGQLHTRSFMYAGMALKHAVHLAQGL